MVAAALVGWTGGLIQAQEYDFPILLPKWERDFSLRTGAGYRDNVGLSSTSPQASAFIMTGLELILLRLPEKRTEFNLFLSGEDLRFLDSSIVNKEQTAFAQALVKTDFGSGWQGSLVADYAYQNQVVDVSAAEPELGTIPVEGHGLGLREGIRHDFAGDYWVSLEAPVKRQFFRQPLDDYWDYGLRIALGKSYGNKSELSVSYDLAERAYDHEQSRRTDGDTNGDTIPGTHRKSLQHEVRLNWKHYWDAQSRWRTSSRLIARENEDNGTGYFDYTKLQAAEQILFRAKNWDISAEIKLARYDYPHQTGTDLDLARRRSWEVAFNFRCERRLSSFLKVFAEYDREEVSSNLDIEQYRVNTVRGGLNWVF